MKKENSEPKTRERGQLTRGLFQTQTQTGLAALLCLAAALPATARENKYDVLSKVIAPIAAVFAEREGGGPRSLSADVTLVKMTGFPGDVAAARAEMAFQSPDKMLLRGPVLGEPTTLVRDGEQAWAAPGERARKGIASITGLPPVDRNYRFGPFRLPVPAKQLAFLPALFTVTDRGSEAVAGRECRVLELRLMPELARSAKLEQWSARLWVDADYKPAQLQVSEPGWEIVVRFDRVAYGGALPASTWAEPESDVLKMSAPELKQLWDWALRNLGEAKSARPADSATP